MSSPLPAGPVGTARRIPADCATIHSIRFAMKLIDDLTAALPGRVRTDPVSRFIYSTDASIYQIQPAVVVIPSGPDDLVPVLRIAAGHGTPVLLRGAGTSLAGQTVGSGVVVDCSPNLNRILEVNREEAWARVEPGVVLDQLNDHLRPLGLFFAPDVATSTRATLGGMIGNNSSGMRSIRYGKTVDHVLQIDALLASGEPACFAEVDMGSARTADGSGRSASATARLGSAVHRIVQENREEIRSRYPRVMRRVSGYNLDELLDERRFNLAKLLVGSEGTLAVTVQARLRLLPLPRARAVAVLHFRDLMEAIRLTPELLHFEPSAVELLDRYALDLARDNPAVSGLAARFLQGRPDAVLLVEFSGEPGEIRDRISELGRDLSVRSVADAVTEALDPGLQQCIWQVRKNALGVMMAVRGDFKPVAFIEDSCVPVERLAEYVADVQRICAGHGRQLSLYAHAGVGVIHMRPLLNLKQEEDVRILREISEEVFERVVHYGGSWSGEHGDGLARSYQLRRFFGDRLYDAFRQVKEAFDPAGLLNPGKILDAPAPTEDLRISPTYRPSYPRTWYRFQEEGGFGSAVELCTGVGQCRKLSGVMCPSYLATRDEEHSTRGRANALRSAIAGDLGGQGFTDPRLYEVLDLCLECKACKSECPSNVDMAKLKAEFLSHYYRRHGLPLRRRLVGAVRPVAETASLFARLANRVASSSLNRRILEWVAGLDRRRRLPAYAPRTLGAWFRGRYRPRSEGRVVTLFADTFTNFHEPEVGIASVQLLHALGFRVRLHEGTCCGRPLISSGRLEEARRQGGEALPYLSSEDGPLLVLEPSCYATFKDDWPDLMEDARGARWLAERTVCLEELLAEPEVRRRLAGMLNPVPGGILFHAHCQQRSLMGTGPTLDLLRLLPGTEIREVAATCCGMAGVFGYEREHYELSRQIGELHLLPAVRAADERVRIAVPGFSCRSQVLHFTGRQAVHPAILVAQALGIVETEQTPR